MSNFFDNIQLDSFISGLYTVLRIISRRDSGFTTSSPCGVWGCGWTTCLLYDSPLLDLLVGVQVWYSEEEFSIDFLTLFMYITQSLSVISSPHFYYSEITFVYVKQFLLPYSKDVFSTFSFYMRYVFGMHYYMSCRSIVYIADIFQNHVTSITACGVSLGSRNSVRNVFEIWKYPPMEHVEVRKGLLMKNSSLWF